MWTFSFDIIQTTKIFATYIFNVCIVLAWPHHFPKSGDLAMYQTRRVCGRLYIYIYMLGVTISPVFNIFRFDFATVSMVWYFWFPIGFWNTSGIVVLCTIPAIHPNQYNLIYSWVLVGDSLVFCIFVC